MQKVQVGIRPGRLELREGVEPRLLRPPIEGPTPIVDEAAKVTDVRPVEPGVAGRSIGKTRARETLAQVPKIAVGNVQRERLRHRLLLGPRFSNGGRLEVKRTGAVAELRRWARALAGGLTRAGLEAKVRP